jgi:hypothetical protein
MGRRNRARPDHVGTLTDFYSACRRPKRTGEGRKLDPHPQTARMLVVQAPRLKASRSFSYVGMKAPTQLSSMTRTDELYARPSKLCPGNRRGPGENHFVKFA